LVREFEPGTLRLLESADDIVKRCGNPEILLLQAKLLTTLKVVVGVEYGTDGLGTLLVANRAFVVTTVELLEIKFSACSLAGP